MAKVITVINQKGGVGKTTTAHAVGAWLQLKRHQKVLFLDLDQQGVNAHVKLHQEIRVWALKSAPP